MSTATNAGEQESAEQESAELIWVNSGDSHVVEPLAEWRRELPEQLGAQLPYLVTYEDHQTVNLNGQTFTRALPPPPKVEFSDRSIGPVGASHADDRLADLDREGIWGEVVFPTVGMWNSSYRDRDDHRAILEFANDWAKAALLDVSRRYVPAAQIPMLSVSDATAELERCVGLGFHLVNLSTTPATSVPDYNDIAWEPFWEVAAAAGMVLGFHVGTDAIDFTTGQVRRGVTHEGAGDAMLNYAETSFTGQRVAMKLVAGGALDRHPTLRVLIAEGGASWIPALGDRMNEAYHHHDSIVEPKLERSPKEILYSQVYTTFQHDESALGVVAELGYRNIVWGRDYPHLEGTWGHTQQVLRHMYATAAPGVAQRVTRDAFSELFPHVGAPPADRTDDAWSASASHATRR